MKRDASRTLTLPREPAPAADEPGDDALVRETWAARAWGRLAALFRAERRGRTPLEVRLAAENRRLRATLHARDVRVFQLEHEVSLKTSENLILAEEVQLWTEVHGRDRTRVEADQAAAAHVVAQLAPRDPRGGKEEE